MAEVLTTNGISSEIDKIVKTAEQRVVLISPYLKVNSRLQDLLTDANRLKRDIRIVFGKVDLKPTETAWLQELEFVRLAYRENLHAKCYLNESRAVVCSMNLYEFSQQNNDELGIGVTAERDPELFKAVWAEAETLIRNAESYKFRMEREQPERAKTDTRATPAKRSLFERVENGHCIRCAEEIPRNPEKPYCEKHYEIWARYGDENYVDKYCHDCGEKHGATKKKPLCRDCYSASAA